MTDTIDPSAGPADPSARPPDGEPAGPAGPAVGPDATTPRPSPGTGGFWTHGASSFARHDTAASTPSADAEAEPPRSKVVPALMLLAGTALIVRLFGPWGLFIIVGLLISVVLHELGHYLTAKQAGMKVTEFFVGFGPKLWSMQRGEVEYGVKALPLGAYVRIIGMNDLEDIDPADEGRTYREKSYWARLRVVLAGPFMNFAIGFVLLTVLFMTFGQATNTGWKVDQAQPGTAAKAAGLRSGDRLLSLDGKPVSGFEAFGKEIERRAGDPVHLVVLRDGKKVALTATVGWILADSGAAKLAPLATGDQITEVGKTSVASYAAARQLLGDAPKGLTTVQIERDGNAYTTQLHTPIALPADGAHGFLGISASPRIARQGPIQAVGTAGHQFASLIGGSVQALGRFFSPSGLSHWTHYVITGSGAPSQSSTAGQAALVPIDKGAPAASASQPVSANAPENNRILSVVGVLRLGSEAGAEGAAIVLFLLALINVFLGLLNLVPLPPFDGGHAAVATYEAIREKLSGRPYRADMAKLIPVTYAVLVLMGFIFLSSTYLDILHPAQNPFKNP